MEMVMKTRTICIILILNLMVVFLSLSQNKYGLFLHGYESKGSTAWTDVRNVGNIPQTWVAEGIINGFQAPDLPPLTDISALVDSVFAELNKYPNDKWIIVGHSLGGLVARGTEKSIFDANYHLKGIITLGTPHQGAPVAAMVSNTTYVQNIVNTVRNDIHAGPDWQFRDHGLPMDAIGLFGEHWIGKIVGRYVYEVFASSLDSAYATTSRYIKRASGQGADKLAPGSDFLRDYIYPVASNVPHISISGVESSPHSFIRFVSTIDDIGDGFENETDAVNMTNDGLWTYGFFEDYHSWMKNIYLWQYQYHDIAQYRWKRGRIALGSLDTKWFELHNEIRSYYHTGTYQIWVSCDQESWAGGASVKDLEVLFAEYNPCLEGISGYFKTVSYGYTVYYPDQSDGFIPKERTKWKSGEYIHTQSNLPPVADIRQGNISFDGAGEADGGYNHGELRYPKRNYGQRLESRPMKYSKDWANYWILQP